MNGKAIVCFALGLLFLVPVLSKSISTRATDWWPMFHHDLTHTGNSNSTAPNTNQTLWKFNTGGQVNSPAVADSVVYVGSYDHRVYAFNASNGSLTWNYTTGGEVASSPAIANDIVYVGSHDGRLYALSAS